MSLSSQPSQGSVTEQKQSRPPATPIYILRGHSSPIHALRFYRKNLRLISGDADGWVVIWNTVTKRPVVVWKAHEGAILAVKGRDVGGDGEEGHIFTHGRDHKLRVWRMRSDDEALLSQTLPVEDSEQSKSAKGGEPWLLHSLSVNALNFCAFAMCLSYEVEGQRGLRGEGFGNSEMPAGKLEQPANQGNQGPAGSHSPGPTTFLATPNAMDSGAADIFYLPAEKRVCTVSSDTCIKTGMIMAVDIFFSTSGDMYLVSGYEDGHVMVHLRRGPVLLKDLDYGPGANPAWKWERIYINRAHSQPILSLDVTPTTPKTHFFTSSADATIAKHPIPEAPKSLIGGALKAESSTPLKSVNTKHAGQQDLRLRSDGRIYATAGWDSRVRVYSSKTLKELAVLKWHKDGCYSVAFADVNLATPQGQAFTEDAKAKGQDSSEEVCKEVATTEGIGSLAAVQQQRSRKAQNTHWLAAGSKDGKISLWDIF